MKSLLAVLVLMLSVSAFAVEYPVKNFKYISDFDYREEVLNSDKFVVMVFSSKECLERTITDRSCFLFEKKLDFYIPKFSSKLKFVGFDTYFDNYTVSSEFRITKTPTVIILKNNQIIKRFELAARTYNPQTPPYPPYYYSPQDQLLTEVVNTLNQIR